MPLDSMFLPFWFNSHGRANYPCSFIAFIKFFISKTFFIVKSSRFLVGYTLNILLKSCLISASLLSPQLLTKIIKIINLCINMFYSYFALAHIFLILLHLYFYKNAHCKKAYHFDTLLNSVHNIL